MSRHPAQIGGQSQENSPAAPPLSARASRPRFPGGPLTRCLHLMAVVCVGALGGCAQGTSAPASGSDAEGQAEHAYEHHNPPHKPHDFPGGLDALRKRCSDLFASAPSKPPQAGKEFNELVDIVGWLPELAADSDLDRAEWDRVNEQSKRLARDVDEFTRAGLEGSEPRSRQKIESDLQALDDVVRRHPDIFGQKSGVDRADRKNDVQYVERPRT